VPEDTTEVFEPEEGAVEAETELELGDVPCTAEELVAREPGVGLAIAVVVVARTELPVLPASAGVSITSGSAATKTKATFWARCMLPSDSFEGAIWEGSAVRTAMVLVETRSALNVEFE
jgi:hypothetical protein